MANNTFAQSWNAYRYADGVIVLTNTVDATGFTLRFYIAAVNPGPTTANVLTVTPTISTVTISIPLTADQMTNTLTADGYFAALWRIDSGSTKPLANGRLNLTTIPHP